MGQATSQLDPIFFKESASLEAPLHAQFAYVANGGGNNVSGYTINPTTGALTAIGGSPFPAGNFPSSVAVTPRARIKIEASASGSRDPSTAVGESVVNGDFLIVRNRVPGSTTGDGINEETSWTFDFNDDENYRRFESSTGPLTSARLTLTLTPKIRTGESLPTSFLLKR